MGFLSHNRDVAKVCWHVPIRRGKKVWSRIVCGRSLVLVMVGVMSLVGVVYFNQPIRSEIVFLRVE